MYFEYCNYNKDIEDYDQELKNIFTAIDQGITGLALPIHMVREVKEFMPKGTVLATSIDYPCGYSSTKVRSHMVLNAVKCGVNAIDYVPNQYFLRNKWTELVSEIKGHLEICREYDATLRVFIDGTKADDIVSLGLRMADLEIEQAFVSIGYHHQDFFDTLLDAKVLEEDTPLSIIFNGYMWRPDQVEIVKKSGLFGARIYNLKLWCS